MLSLEKRPKTINEMIGHTTIMSEFKNRSKNLNFPQVMLFVGKPGSGKNTIAYIIAKLINCENLNKVGHYYEPCNECKSCNDINNENFSRDTKYVDCTQYDSKDVENLNRLALLQPMFDKSKVFILDEFQSLGNKNTKSKTNNLLEKVRKHVYFILCARDSSTIPNDLLQRCQIYNFYSISKKIISDYLCKLVIDDESIPEIFYQEGLFTIAENSNGSIRQALQFLERCLEGKLFSSKQIEQELGFISEEKEMNILISLLDAKKEILWDLSNLKDLETFYYRTKKILISANIYKFTKRVDQNWKKDNAETLIKSHNLINLLKCYNFDYSFNKEQFLYKIIEYYNSIYSNIRQVRS